MRKRLSEEQRGDHETLMAGKLWAYTPVVLIDFIGLGIAVANERGYNGIAAFFYRTESWDEAEEEANRLNSLRNINEETSILVIASTMAAQNLEDAKECDEPTDDDDADREQYDPFPVEDLT